jgi:valyl-tRNA synthetase
MGASADWKRFVFMLDPQVVKIVLNTFESLYKKELIYRDFKLVNYCVKCGTAFSDLEVKHVEHQDALYYMKYGPFTIATVRPESMFRDVALAVNPTDPRYQQYLGQTLEIPSLLGTLKMQVIADEEVDPEFGTGIMKVTPAHDPHDYELGKKYNLPVTPIIDFQGKMDMTWFLNQTHGDSADEQKWLSRASNYHGKKVAAVRELIVADLESEGLLVKVNKEYLHSVGTCYRCGSVIEPLPMPQFFIKVKPLTDKVLAAQRKNEFTVYGAGHDKILTHWLENLKDWNISRQIVWGIRLPIWYKASENPTLKVTFLNQQGERVTGLLHEALEGLTAADGTTQKYPLSQVKAGLQELRAPIEAKYIVSLTEPGEEYLQDTDTFDTWFSSAQWPYSTLQANDAKNGTQDFKHFYPTQVMETGYDILPFWVMRMLMMGLFTTNQVPFTSVYMHGLVRDQKGQKMSKSKGNVINPLEIVEKYGADALRMALVIRSSAGLDKSVGDQDFRAMRNLTNKLWNASRFVLLQAEEKGFSISAGVTTSADQQFLARLDQLVKDVSQQLNDFKLGLAAETLYNEFWHWFCDEAIEQTKNGELSIAVVASALPVFLKLFHPFTPFVTEAIWQVLPSELKGKEELLITASWPSLTVS